MLTHRRLLILHLTLSTHYASLAQDHQSTRPGLGAENRRSEREEFLVCISASRDTVRDCSIVINTYLTLLIMPDFGAFFPTARRPKRPHLISYSKPRALLCSCPLTAAFAPFWAQNKQGWKRFKQKSYAVLPSVTIILSSSLRLLRRQRCINYLQPEPHMSYITVARTNHYIQS